VALGVWAAYDTAIAWQRFGLLVAGVYLMLLMAFLGHWRGEVAVGGMALGAAWLAAVIGVYFGLTADWATESAKFAPLQQVGLWIQGWRPGLVLPDRVNANVAGSALALLLPLAVGGVTWGLRRGRGAARVLALLSLLPLGVAAAALLLTASRGAWLGLAAGVGAAAIGWIVLRRAGAGSRARRGWAVGLLLALGLSSAALFALAVTQPQLVRWLGSVGGGVSTSRPDLWRDMLALVRDYPWTGSGLGSTLMVDATYVRLLHVGFIYHAHNLFLQVAIEQGVPGLVFFVAILALAAYRLLVRATPGILALAALAALVVLVVNGLVDAGLYASRLAPLLFVVPGFALAVAAAPGPLPAAQAEDVLVSRRWLWGIPAAVLLVVAVLLVLPGSRATGLANLGAVAQSRAELAVYRWPDVGIQDELRRLELVDLAPAIGYYQAALALDPNNVTANRRLGQIGLSMGDQAVAREHLERAYAAAPGERATRQLLAEVYAVAGEVERARDLWDSVDTAQGQLDGRIWWYENQGNAEVSQRLQALRR
jgi:putative inorganic carbon (HCO3(-)) transporter